MRTRSSRFFVILLHLVGCRPRQSHQGIVAVQPWPIVLEKLDLSALFSDDEGGGSSATRRKIEQEEAVWLQNDAGKCLGPTARFTDCGDATLWFIAKRQQSRRRPFLRMGMLGVEDEDDISPSAHADKEGLAFYVVDRDVEAVNDNDTSSSSDYHPKGWWRRILKRKRPPKMECLTHTADGQVAVESCSRRDSWAWELDSQGGLTPATKPNAAASSSSTSPSPHRRCLVKNHSGGVQLGSCHHEMATDDYVNLSVVRYRAVSLPDALHHLSSSSSSSKSAAVSKEGAGVQNNAAVDLEPLKAPISTSPTRAKTKKAPVRVEASLNTAPPQSSVNLPSRKRDLAHMHASSEAPPPHQHQQHTSLKPPQLKKPALATHRAEERKMSRLQFLHSANPVSLAEQSFGAAKRENANHRMVAPTESSAALPHRTRKIPVHPYIAASQNEVWTDPQTGLQYPTDLSGYLGFNRKEKGRHTLMGVGQYRKGYVIKVYGVAYYVSKRDVLADPFFADYADLTPDELRAKPEFYEHLRLHEENFDRTLIIKINMQLAADTIRSSLHADWKMLTEEAKDALISSSLQRRPATEALLKVVADEANNPGRCSCGQVCPEEYEADVDCCARGTELGFTWLKTGDLQVRIQ